MNPFAQPQSLGEKIAQAVSLVLGCRCCVCEDGNDFEIYVLNHPPHKQQVTDSTAEIIVKRIVENATNEHHDLRDWMSRSIGSRGASLSCDGGKTWKTLFESPKPLPAPNHVAADLGQDFEDGGLEACACENEVAPLPKNEATPDIVDALKRDHYQVKVLGLRDKYKCIGEHRADDVWFDLNNAFYATSPYDVSTPENEFIATTRCEFARFMAGIMGYAPNADDLKKEVEQDQKRWMDFYGSVPKPLTDEVFVTPFPVFSSQEANLEESLERAFSNGAIRAFAGATDAQRSGWANQAIDKIYAMKMAPKVEVAK